MAPAPLREAEYVIEPPAESAWFALRVIGQTEPPQEIVGVIVDARRSISTMPVVGVMLAVNEMLFALVIGGTLTVITAEY